MARTKKTTIATAEAEIKTPVEAVIRPVEAPKGESAAHVAFKGHIERYSRENPEKFASKREALMAKLSTL